MYIYPMPNSYPHLLDLNHFGLPDTGSLSKKIPKILLVFLLKFSRTCLDPFLQRDYELPKN